MNIFTTKTRFLAQMASFLCVAGLLASCTSKPSGPVDNVVLIIVDTLAARHLGVYGAANSPSPNIDSFARSSTVFEKAYSPSSWTKPAVASIFTGVMPSVHDVRSIDIDLNEDHPTLATRLKNIKIQSAGFISHTFISPEMGYGQGFDRYETLPFRGNVHDVVSSKKITDLGIDWLKENVTTSKKPFFLFLHYFDPHNNYQHHESFDRSSWYNGEIKPGMDIRDIRNRIPEMNDDDIKYIRDLYDEEIAFTDEQIGRFLKFLKDMNLSDRTLVVLTADHGEEFLNHGAIGHSRTLYDELIHVPLIVRLPAKGQARRVEANVTTLDILPTVMDLFGIDKDPQLQGVSLKETLIDSNATPPARDIISEVDFRSRFIKSNKIAAIRGDYKLVLDKPTSTFELFNLKSDPREIENIVSVDTVRVAEMGKVITDYKDKYQQNDEALFKRKKKIESTPEEVEQLESLGYL